jgi:Insertion element 4 transposase N-terminal
MGAPLGAQSATMPVLSTRADAHNSQHSPRVPVGERFGERIRLGVLTCWITPEIVDEVLERTGRVEFRRRLLPTRAVMYFVLALCLFSSAESTGQPGYRAVLRTLTEKLRNLPGLPSSRGGSHPSALTDPCVMPGFRSSAGFRRFRSAISAGQRVAASDGGQKRLVTRFFAGVVFELRKLMYRHSGV